MENPAAQSYKEEILKELSDPTYCEKYLSACLRESQATFLLGLRYVAEAQSSMSQTTDIDCELSL